MDIWHCDSEEAPETNTHLAGQHDPKEFGWMVVVGDGAALEI